MFSDWPLALALCVFVSCWLTALVYAVAGKGASWADPIIQFLGFYALFTLPLPIRALITQEIEGDVTKHLPQLLAYLPASVLLAALGIVCFVVAYYSDIGARLARRLPRTGRPRRNPHLTAILLVGFSLFLIAVLARSVGGIINFVLLGYSSSETTFQNGYLAIGFPWLYVGVCFFLYRYGLYRQHRDLVFYAAGFLVITAMQMVMGNRSIVLYMVLVTVAFWHFGVRRISLARLVPLGGAGFVALNIAGFLRASHYESPADLLRQWTDGFTRVASSGEVRHGWYYTMTTGEFVVPFETLPQMVRSVGTEIPPKWGTSFAAAPAFFVPSVLFPNRPLPLPNWYMQHFYGDEKHGLNEGRAFFFLAEGYLNFGPIGIPLLALLWGVLWRTTREYLARSQYEPGAALLYAFTIAYMFRLIAGDSRSLLVGVAEQDLVPAIIGLTWLGAWRFNRRPSSLAEHA